ncbi:MAG: ASPIC/UnbV domain-containing protein [Acidobacteria bacterium]|nr:ASPIC/UnbV domain-containing protein [Acidobacteriota bacterium]
MDEARSGDSYISHSDWRLPFGLGQATTVDEITIRWPSGGVEKLTALTPERH